ncbi:NAD(P)/FAD-dependent oxidoreductase [Nocardioides ultimimeridianus]
MAADPRATAVRPTDVRRLTGTHAEHLSYWMVDAVASEDEVLTRPTLDRDLSADVCVVGGGFTGLWTAIELKRRDPGTDVVLIEANICGAGASGANAGIAMNLWPKLGAMMAAGGTDEAVALAHASTRAVHFLIDFCETNGIDAQVRRTGWLWASTNRTQDGAWDDAVRTASSYDGSPFTVLDATTASELAGTQVRGGVLDSTCAHLHPGRLARGLARVAEGLGVRIHERTPMTGIRYSTGDPVVTTPTGSVRSSSVVLAVNAWAANFRQFRRHLVMTASDNLILKPDRPLVDRGLASVSDAGRLLDYWRPLTDGKLLFGKAGLGLGFGGRGASTLYQQAPRAGRLRRQLLTALPELSGARTVSAWRAPVEYSVSSLPFFVPLAEHPRVFCGTGYSGDGIGPSVLGGRVLASQVMGVRDELSTSFLTREPAGRGLPPEPFRFLGGQAVKAALLRGDRLADAARPIDPLTRLVSRIDPTSFVG